MKLAVARNRSNYLPSFVPRACAVLLSRANRRSERPALRHGARTIRTAYRHRRSLHRLNSGSGPLNSIGGRCGLAGPAARNSPTRSGAGRRDSVVAIGNLRAAATDARCARLGGGVDASRLGASAPAGIVKRLLSNRVNHIQHALVMLKAGRQHGTGKLIEPSGTLARAANGGPVV